MPRMSLPSCVSTWHTGLFVLSYHPHRPLQPASLGGKSAACFYLTMDGYVQNLSSFRNVHIEPYFISFPIDLALIPGDTLFQKNLLTTLPNFRLPGNRMVLSV